MTKEAKRIWKMCHKWCFGCFFEDFRNFQDTLVAACAPPNVLRVTIVQSPLCCEDSIGFLGHDDCLPTMRFSRGGFQGHGFSYRCWGAQELHHCQVQHLVAICHSLQHEHNTQYINSINHVFHVTGFIAAF